MVIYYKPQSPIQSGEDFIYPITTADQIMKSDKSRRLEQAGLIVADDSTKLGGVAAKDYALKTDTAPDSSKLGGVAASDYALKTDTAPDSSKLGGQLPAFYATAEDVAHLLYNNAGAHNAIYRGKDLGSAVTDAQWAAIAAGTYNDMYIGDYWTIGDITYRIAAFDYYYKTGDISCDVHHVTLVPDVRMYNHVMNDTGVTTGAYVGSKMYTEGLTQAKNTINNAFGSSHILNHKQYLQNAVTNGYASAGSWYDSTVELMTEQNIYGCRIFGNMINGTSIPDNYTLDNSQYPLFKFRPDMISNGVGGWLRDVVSNSHFAALNINGRAAYATATYALSVRPAFSIC